MPDKEYYIIDNKQQIGPFRFKELKKMRLPPHTLLWIKGNKTLQQAKDIKGLAGKGLQRYQGIFEMVLFAILVTLVALVIYFS